MESTDESSPRSLDLIFNPSVNYFNRFDLWIEKQPLIVSVMATTLSLVFSPLLCIVGMALLSMPARFYMKLFLDVNVVSNSSSQRHSGMYARAETTHRRQWMWLGSQMCRFVMLLVAILLVVNFFVSHLKGLPLLAFPLWKWSLFAFTLTSAYLECLMIPVLLYSIFKSRLVRNSLSTQFLYWSLMRNVSLCLYFGLVLLAWMLYFRTEHGLKHNNHATEARNEAFEYVTWSLISLFVGSILLALGHAYLLRYWFIKRIYGSFEARILFTWIKYLYLALLVDDFVPAGVGVIVSLEHLKPRNASLTHYIISAKTDIGILCKGANVLQRLAKIVISREEDGLSDVVKWCQDKIARNDDECGLDDLRNLFPSEKGKRVAKILHDIIGEECSPNQITFDDVKKWLVDAHKDCVNLGRTITDACEVVHSLRVFMRCTIVAAVVLFWLMITGIATTKVLITIATPLLASTFVFGDTSKTFFQGVIFAAIIHPFQVGDRCIIDETELEVKSISILTTTFTKIVNKEKRLYPNSVLATKAVVNLGSQPDPSDVVHLTLDSSTSVTDLDNLEAKINEFFNDPQQKGSYEKSHELMIEELGEKIKVIVHFTHVLSIKEVTHKQCLQKKNKQRSEFLKQIKRFLEHKDDAKQDQNGSQATSLTSHDSCERIHGS